MDETAHTGFRDHQPVVVHCGGCAGTLAVSSGSRRSGCDPDLGVLGGAHGARGRSLFPRPGMKQLCEGLRRPRTRRLPAAGYASAWARRARRRRERSRSWRRCRNAGWSPRCLIAWSSRAWTICCTRAWLSRVVWAMARALIPSAQARWMFASRAAITVSSCAPSSRAWRPEEMRSAKSWSISSFRCLTRPMFYIVPSQS